MNYNGMDAAQQHFTLTRRVEELLGFELLYMGDGPRGQHLSIEMAQSAAYLMEDFISEIKGGSFVLPGEFTLPERFKVRDPALGACSDAWLPRRMMSREYTNRSFIERAYKLMGVQHTTKRLVQIILADRDNKLPHEEGYQGHCQTLELI